MPRGTVHVVGNASVDVTLPVARLPLPGETLIATGPARRAAGGKGLNQAVVAARVAAATGARVRLLAPVGAERAEIGAALAGEALAGDGLAEVSLPAKEVPTDISVLLVAADGANAIVSTGACAQALTPGEVRDFLGVAEAGDVVLLQGNLSREATVAAFGVGRVVLNLAPVRWGLPALPAGCVLVVNEVEAGQIAGGAAEDAARRLAAGGAEVVVTLGGEGVVWCAGGELMRLKAPAARVVDTTGAGDVFCGALAAALLEGVGMEAAIGLAQVLAAMSVGREGCLSSFPSRDECAHAWRALRAGAG